MIISRGTNVGEIVDGETELQEKIETYYHVMVPGDPVEQTGFPSSIGEIVFK
jgi:hypothetical protein